MLIEQDAHPIVADPRATAARLVANLPADQALGLRLMALAQAAAAIHLNEWFLHRPLGHNAGAPPDSSGLLAHSQAAGLLLHPEVAP